MRYSDINPNFWYIRDNPRAYDYLLDTDSKLKLKEHIHFVPLSRWLENIDYFDSVKKYTSYIDTISFDKNRTEQDLFFYLNQSKLLTKEKTNRIKDEQDYVMRFIQYFHKELYIGENYWINAHKIEYANKRRIKREEFIECCSVEIWGTQKYNRKSQRRTNIRKLIKGNGFKKRILNYYFPPYYNNTHYSINNLFTNNLLDSTLLKLDYSFYLANLPLSPTHDFSNFVNNSPNQYNKIITIENTKYPSLSSSPIKTAGRYTDNTFLIAIPNKEILGNTKRNSKIPDLEPCVNCLPKLFLSKDMIDYEHQKVFLLEYLKKQLSNKEDALKLFIYLQLIPTHILRPLNISPDITLTKKGNTYEWECSAGFKEYNYNNYKIKGILKGTTIKGELVFPEEVEEELKEFKKLGFTIKEKGKRFTL